MVAAAGAGAGAKRAAPPSSSASSSRSSSSSSAGWTMGARALSRGGGGGEDPGARRLQLAHMMGRVEAQLQSLEAQGPLPEIAPKSRARGVQVIIGTSELAWDSAMVERIMTMVNESYYESMKELLHPRQKSYERLSKHEVIDRLRMGDEGLRANRVLHVAYRGDALTPSSVVGCMSSTYQPPWTEEGCGHWGLLVVDKDAQGQGFASVLVEAAELRLAGVCHEIQIEYEYTPGHAYSERLEQWYEGTCGFKCMTGYGRRPGTQFRKCRKPIEGELSRCGEVLRLRELKRVLLAELASLPEEDEACAPELLDNATEEAEVEALAA